ncbi:ABC transporter ATP-binding protein [Pseudonocardia alni]|uniref:ABC transporter ATP-binding protein n=1 Tax=Pseudonocardia alni TaxID=33907 RepID=UPI00331697BE
MTRTFVTEDLTVRYGGLTALHGVSITVEPGEFAGLIGPNGAGKTTFIDAVTGFTPATGRVTLGDVAMLPLPAHRRVGAGLSRTFQNLELFEDLTVRENVLVATERSHWWSPVAEFVRPVSSRLSEVVEEVLDLVGLAGHVDAYPPDLSLSARKLVSVARALAGRPSVLLLDEPAAGLDSDASLALGEQLRRVAASGVSVLLVDHDMDLVLRTCERINVLDFGKLIASGPTAQVREDPAVVAAYLGHADDAEAIA